MHALSRGTIPPMTSISKLFIFSSPGNDCAGTLVESLPQYSSSSLGHHLRMPGMGVIDPADLQAQMNAKPASRINSSRRDKFSIIQNKGVHLDILPGMSLSSFRMSNMDNFKRLTC